MSRWLALFFAGLLLVAGPAQAAPTRFVSPNYTVQSIIFGGTGVLRYSAGSVPPQILSGPSVSNITTSVATISWVTDKPSTSVVMLGTSPGSYPDQRGQVADAIYTNHAVTLTELLRGQRYYYKVRSVDVNGNVIESGEQLFSTDPGDITPPVVTSGPTITNASATSLIVTWTTDELASSVVEYGTKAVDDSTAGKPDELTVFHQVQLNVQPSQTYLLRIKSRDASGNLYTGPTLTVTTLSAPSITNVTVSDITLDSALVQWQTSSPANSQLSYGTASHQYPSGQTDASFTQNHLVRLTALQSGTAYYLRIFGQDQSGNRLSSDEYVFKTVVLPSIDNLKVSQITADSALVTYTSSSDIDELARYDITASQLDPKLVGKRQTTGSEKASSSHSFQLTDLASSSTYTLSVLGKDVFGNQALSKSVQFSTPVDKVPPEIRNVKTDTTVDLGGSQTVQVLVSFELSKPSITVIEYGEGASGSYDRKVTTDTDLSLSKFLVIPGLQPGRSYHFHIVATDRVGNTATSADYLVRAPTRQVSLLDLIFGQVQQNFGWLQNIGH